MKNTRQKKTDRKNWNTGTKRTRIINPQPFPMHDCTRIYGNLTLDTCLTCMYCAVLYEESKLYLKFWNGMTFNVLIMINLSKASWLRDLCHWQRSITFAASPKLQYLNHFLSLAQVIFIFPHCCTVAWGDVKIIGVCVPKTWNFNLMQISLFKSETLSKLHALSFKFLVQVFQVHGSYRCCKTCAGEKKGYIVRNTGT